MFHFRERLQDSWSASWPSIFQCWYVLADIFDTRTTPCRTWCQELDPSHFFSASLAACCSDILVSGRLQALRQIDVGFVVKILRFLRWGLTPLWLESPILCPSQIICLYMLASVRHRTKDEIFVRVRVRNKRSVWWRTLCGYGTALVRKRVFSKMTISQNLENGVCEYETGWPGNLYIFRMTVI